MKAGDEFETLLGLMRRLRAPDGCPWDRAQTPETLKTYVVEEAYEVVEAIERGDPELLLEELGDLLLQVVFLAQLAEEAGRFDMADVCKAIVSKLLRRHPHVFGDQKANSPDEAYSRWHARKREEGKGTLSGVPNSLPALLMALRMSEKAHAVGFDWPDIAGALAKLDEEVAELKRAVASLDRDQVEAELGDVLFTVVNLARLHRIDPEAALRRMLARFRRRFEHLEARLNSQGLDVKDQPLSTLDALWEEAKREGL